VLHHTDIKTAKELQLSTQVTSPLLIAVQPPSSPPQDGTIGASISPARRSQTAQILQRNKRSHSLSSESNISTPAAASLDIVERRKDKKGRKRDPKRRSVIAGLTPFSSASSKRDSESKPLKDSAEATTVDAASSAAVPRKTSSLSSLPSTSVYGTEVTPMGPVFTLGIFHGGLAFTDIERFCAKYGARKNKQLIPYLRERNAIIPLSATSPTEQSSITTSAIVVACGANSIAVLCMYHQPTPPRRPPCLLTRELFCRVDCVCVCSRGRFVHVGR
jgi:hypothetical protein